MSVVAETLWMADPAAFGVDVSTIRSRPAGLAWTKEHQPFVFLRAARAGKWAVDLRYFTGNEWRDVRLAYFDDYREAGALAWRCTYKWIGAAMKMERPDAHTRLRENWRPRATIDGHVSNFEGMYVGEHWEQDDRLHASWLWLHGRGDILRIATKKDVGSLPGVLGELVEWIAGTSRRPNPMLALGAALCIIGTLVGRRAATPTRSGTHLYVAALAPTGAGKQHALNCIMRAMKAAKAEHHIGPSEFISMPAVINFLLAKPLSICPQDEFGAFLKRVNNKRASGFESSISKVLRSAWGASFEAFPTPEWAGRSSIVIWAPAISLFGLSTQDEFYEALQGPDVTNGFLNRFLVLNARKRIEEREPEIDAMKIPEGLAKKLQALYSWDGNAIGNARLNDPALQVEPQIIPWADDAAHALYTDLSKEVEAKMERQPALEPFIARTAEIALRLATIRAVGRDGPSAKVEGADMQWARNLVSESTDAMAGDAIKRMVVDMSAGQMQSKVMEIIEREGGKISRRDVMRRLGRSIKSRRELDEVVAILEDAGQITIKKVWPASGGKPTTYLELIR